MNYTIILAGGTGKRFWPLSRESQPKQFLNVYSMRPLIEETIGRIKPLVSKENTYIATGRIYSRKIETFIKKSKIPSRNILFEPASKNTFAPIAVLSRSINELDPEAVIIVLPSDHFIRDKGRLLKVLAAGIEIAKKGYVVALGIPPTRPETGYGYIKIKSKVLSQKSKVKAYEVDRFVEKPSLKEAKRLTKEKKYYWNCGIFIFRSQVILEEIKKFMPDIYKLILRVKNKKYFNSIWDKFPSIAVDYAIMEKTKRMALLPADCGWTDLGSWESIDEIAKKDKNGNVFRGKHIDIGSKDILTWSDKRLITTLGLSNIIIVDTKDALLVCRKDMSQEVRKVVALLEKKNFKGEI